MPKTSVLILQGMLADYRRPLFNALAERYAVTVLHGGTPAKQGDDRYEEVCVPARAVGPFHLQDNGAVRDAIMAHDAVVAMFDLRWPAYWRPLFLASRPRYILHGHRYSGKTLADAARNRLMRRADCLLMYGDEEVQRMIASGIDARRIVIAPNTIDVPGHEDGSSATKGNFLYVGRLQDRKMLDMAIRCFARLQGRIDPAIGFDIVGAGPPEAMLRDCAQSHGVASKVHFHGEVRDPALLKAHFMQAIAYLSPGPVGLAVLHSFAFGVPVVTLRSGRHGPEFLNIKNDQNSVIVDDEAAFESAMMQLSTTPALARRLGQSAYDHYASRRTLAHMVAGFHAAIDGHA